MSRVLVTGSSGFVGRYVCEKLLDDGYEVIGIGSLERKGDSLRITSLINHHSQKYTHIRHDLRSPFTDPLIEKIGKIDSIFSIASDSSVADSLTKPREIVLNNTELILSLLEYARIVKPKKFIHLSTDEVYGEVWDSLHKESWIYSPSNPYSASKMSQEGIIYSYWRTFQIPAIIVNCMNMFGIMQNKEKMIPKTISYLKSANTIPIYSSNGKIGSRVYLDCRNLSDALSFINSKIEPTYYLKKDNREDPLKFNVAGNNSIDNLSLVKKIAELMNINIMNVDIIDDSKIRPGYDRNYGLDDSLLRSLGWNPPFSFESGLKNTIEWTLRNTEWM